MIKKIKITIDNDPGKILDQCVHIFGIDWLAGFEFAVYEVETGGQATESSQGRPGFTDHVRTLRRITFVVLGDDLVEQCAVVVWQELQNRCTGRDRTLSQMRVLDAEPTGQHASIAASEQDHRRLGKLLGVLKLVNVDGEVG